MQQELHVTDHTREIIFCGTALCDMNKKHRSASVQFVLIKYKLNQFNSTII